MKNRLLLAVSSLLVAIAAHAQQPPPPGSYTQSCAGLRVENGVLHAQCSTAPLNPTSLQLPCPYTIENRNGRLVCAMATPTGPYLKTCKDVRVEGATLIATCTAKIQFMKERMTLQLPCEGSVDNKDGKLVCVKPAGK